jgi:hypothetical protein
MHTIVSAGYFYQPLIQASKVLTRIKLSFKNSILLSASKIAHNTEPNLTKRSNNSRNIMDTILLIFGLI